MDTLQTLKTPLKTQKIRILGDAGILGGPGGLGPLTPIPGYGGCTNLRTCLFDLNLRSAMVMLVVLKECSRCLASLLAEVFPRELLGASFPGQREPQ